MANAYGTAEYYRYIKDYPTDLDFVKDDEEYFTFGNVRAKAEHFDCTFTYNGCDCQVEKTVFTVTDENGTDHVYECIDTFMRPYYFEYNGAAYIIFRKTLYGYTILNLTDFSEVNYFPSDVLNSGEAFITCEAKLFVGALVLFGCYWGGPYVCYALDLKTFKTVDLSGALGMEDVADNGVTVSGDVLTLVDGNTDKSYSIRYDELTRLIVEKGSEDI